MSDELIQRAADVLRGCWKRWTHEGMVDASVLTFCARALAEAGLLNPQPTTGPTRSEAARALGDVDDILFDGTISDALDALEALGVEWAPEPRKVPAKDLPICSDKSPVTTWPQRGYQFWTPLGQQMVPVFDGPDAAPRCVPADELVEVSPVGCREDAR